MPRDKNIFTLNPTSLDMKRSVFSRNSQHKTSFNLGSIIPIYMDEILPGDTVTMDLAQVIRMSTPIAPIMDNIYADVYFFSIPNRLVWNHWQQFCGENDTTAWTQTTTYNIPSRNVGQVNGDTITIGCLGDYFGLPLNDNQVTSGILGKPNTIYVSELPLRAYAKVYNDWFRDENSIAPILYTIGDSANNWMTLAYSQAPYKASRFHDLFSSALPGPQKGGSVSLPLGTTAPLKSGTTEYSLEGKIFGSNTGSGVNNVMLEYGTGLDSRGVLTAQSTTGSTGGQILKSNLVADLQNATAATINSIRMAFQLQKLLEKDARGGRFNIFFASSIKKIAEKIWKTCVRLIRGEGICQPQRIATEIM